jgi:hypothetical protein
MHPQLHPLLAAALDEAGQLSTRHHWLLPGQPALDEATRLLALVAPAWPAPAVRIESNGAITFDWECGERGWVELTLDGSGQLTHNAVIDADDYGQTEPWPAARDAAAAMPGWACEVLRRLLGSRH